MGWIMKVIVLVALQYIFPSCGAPHPFPLEPLDDNYVESTGVFEEENTGMKPVPQTVDTEKMDLIGNYLTELLMLPWNGNGLPLLYVEEEPSDDLYGDLKDGGGSGRSYEQFNSEIAPAPFKRSRYYRKYPWKRQNSRQTYDAENRYLCQPSKDDVLRLLVALHEARQGTKGRTINFCNRKRPATAIFTNIRFLG